MAPSEMSTSRFSTNLGGEFSRLEHSSNTSSWVKTCVDPNISMMRATTATLLDDRRASRKCDRNSATELALRPMSTSLASLRRSSSSKMFQSVYLHPTTLPANEWNVMTGIWTAMGPRTARSRVRRSLTERLVRLSTSRLSGLIPLCDCVLSRCAILLAIVLVLPDPGPALIPSKVSGLKSLVIAVYCCSVHFISNSIWTINVYKPA
ncbi:hypothetical protein OGATHE_003508 [Ogataea polymorpha]|uniref:Uncharacterized protein n=1 Tax=Ogataea polymorpha TaxID=460523 RepID=A0A9P8P361_9ASCO|nr:hypothetical protein OGATHE_003508 [Ogataea polymorpha]